MKETAKTFVIVVLLLLVALLSIEMNKYYQKTQEKPLQPEKVYLTDTITITNVVYDTVYLERYKTVKLPTTDTLILTNDSLRIDSVFVEVPISVYKFDSTLTTDTTCLNIRIQNSGYDVKLDSLSYKFEYTPRPPKTNFFKEHFNFGAGVSTGFGVFSKKPDVFLSIGFYYCF